MYLKILGMRIQSRAQNLPQCLHIALTVLTTVHTGRSTDPSLFHLYG
jgi:hypothetical protein